MDAATLANCIAHGRPGEEFIYRGDGSTLDDLEWNGSGKPPTLDEIKGWEGEIADRPPSLPAASPGVTASAIAAAVAAALDVISPGASAQDKENARTAAEQAATDVFSPENTRPVPRQT